MGRWRMPGLLRRGALGRLGAAADVETFAFKRLTVRVPVLSRRRRLQVAMDGEVDKMALPRGFRVVEECLWMLVPEAAREAARAAADDADMACRAGARHAIPLRR